MTGKLVWSRYKLAVKLMCFGSLEIISKMIHAHDSCGLLMLTKWKLEEVIFNIMKLGVHCYDF